MSNVRCLYNPRGTYNKRLWHKLYSDLNADGSYKAKRLRKYFSFCLGLKVWKGEK